MNRYNHGITKKIADWAISRGLTTTDELSKYNEYDAATLIDCYNIHHNEKCFVYSKMIDSQSGGKMFDSVVGYLHEDYDSAKERERLENLEKDDLMNQEI